MLTVTSLIPEMSVELSPTIFPFAFILPVNVAAAAVTIPANVALPFGKTVAATPILN